MRNSPLRAFASPLKQDKKLATKMKKAKINVVGKHKNPPHFLTRKKTVPMEGYIAPINTPKGVKGPKLPRL